MAKKVVTLAQLLESARRSEALDMQIAQAVNGELEGKQDKLTGTAGQVVGFNAQGQAVAQAAPTGGLTQTQADARYLKLSGGTMTGALSVREPASGMHAATKKYVDTQIRAALNAVHPKIASISYGTVQENVTLELTENTYGANDVPIYKLNYTGRFTDSGTSATVRIAPPAGYAFTYLVSTYVPYIYVNGQSYTGRLLGGSIAFEIGSHISANTTFTFMDGEQRDGALLCLEVA